MRGIPLAVTCGYLCWIAPSILYKIEYTRYCPFAAVGPGGPFITNALGIGYERPSWGLVSFFRVVKTTLSSSYNISGLVPVCWLLFQCF